MVLVPVLVLVLVLVLVPVLVPVQQEVLLHSQGWGEQVLAARVPAIGDHADALLQQEACPQSIDHKLGSESNRHSPIVLHRKMSSLGNSLKRKATHLRI